MFLVEIFMINKSRNAKQPCATRFIIFNRPTYLLTCKRLVRQHFLYSLKLDLIFADPAFVFTLSHRAISMCVNASCFPSVSSSFLCIIFPILYISQHMSLSTRILSLFCIIIIAIEICIRNFHLACSSFYLYILVDVHFPCFELHRKWHFYCLYKFNYSNN